MESTFPILEKIDILVEQGIYQNRATLMQDALRALLRSKPELRTRLAIELYRQGEVSLTRAAEIGGMDIEDFKELVREAGVVRQISPVGEAVQQETNQLLRLKRSEQPQ